MSRKSVGSSQRRIVFNIGLLQLEYERLVLFSGLLTYGKEDFALSRILTFHQEQGTTFGILPEKVNFKLFYFYLFLMQGEFIVFGYVLVQ